MQSEDETQCHYVSSLGICKSCDLHSLTPQANKLINYTRDWVGQPDYTTIYVCAHEMRVFITEILPRIGYKFILVSGDADETCPDLILTSEEFARFISDARLVHWFAQNCSLVGHAKMTQIPIGLDYHTLFRGGHWWGAMQTPLYQEMRLNEFACGAAPYWERRMQCFSNFHFMMGTRFARIDRVEAMEKIPADLIYYQPVKMSREDSWRLQTEYAFVISPHGNGYDCHRTWESLILGNIVIVKTSPLDALYADLPVYIVRDWGEITAELLARVAAEFRERRFQFYKLSLKYWTEQFRRAGTAAK